MKRFPSKGQMYRYAMRKARRDWVKELNKSQRKNNYTYGNPKDKLVTPKKSDDGAIFIFIMILVALIFGIVFKITWLWLSITLLFLLTILISFPVLLPILLILGAVVVLSIITK
ncbi:MULTISPECIES: hypothetical protein [Paenibacillus]|uniref:hypothetical protein n=1 Tax=Paenibacillus TaxID=44249 RepID=UPI00096D0C52|nr:hypothetical protein [Paenibacillus odorifer]OMD81168.1 hypothetical protein BSK53_19315 [Paenibacillus odorifer]